MLKIGAVILAAGMSRRMGTPKLFLDFHGKPLFHHSVEAALQSKLNPVILVAGEHIHLFQEHTKDWPVEVLENPYFSCGMASSLKSGINALKGRTDAACVFLADQSFVSPDLIDILLQTYKQNHPNGVGIVRPHYNGLPGHPVLFDSSLFPEFFDLQGDEGGRSIIKRHADELHLVSVENPLWGIDIDTPADLKKYEI